MSNDINTSNKVVVDDLSQFYGIHLTPIPVPVTTFNVIMLTIQVIMSHNFRLYLKEIPIPVVFTSYVTA